MRKSLRWTACAGALTVFLPALARAGDIDAHVAALGGNDDPARSLARQYLPREDVTVVVPKVIPLLKSEKAEVWTAARNVLADIANDVAVAGREADRAAVTKALMTLVTPDQPAEIRLRGLRLVPIVLPPDGDVAPIAAILGEKEIREKARVALEESAAPTARAALRAALKQADPNFTVALLNALGRLKDAEGIETFVGLTKSENPAVRAAAVRALSWTGDPAHLKAAQDVVASADEATKSDATDALMRLINTIERNPNHRSIAIAAYKDVLKSGRNPARDGALAGLGRIGDASCVATVLEAIKTAPQPTPRVGLAALRSIPGADVTKMLIEAFSQQPGPLQLTLFGVLGSRHDAAALAILQQAAQSPDAPVRLAAYAALGEAGLADGVAALINATKKPDAAERAQARKNLLTLADALKAQRLTDPAGTAYLAILDGSTAEEKAARRAALEGLAACPVKEAKKSVQAAAADPELREVVIPALMGVAGKLTQANAKPEALELYEIVRGLKPSAETIQALIKGMTAAGSKADLQTLMGVIPRWWVVGPFELGEKNEGWEKAYIDEPNVDIVGRYMSGKGRVQWKAVVSKEPNGKIDLLASIANRNNCVGYAYAEVIVPQPTDAVLLLGVDDSEKVWINSQKAFELFTARGFTPDQDRVPVKLQAGVNKVLLKIYQNGMGWEFSARLALPDGRPVTFTQKTE